ncbi:MAG: hypothetical protein E6H93_13080 [Chloroflexi bacterium]|nr:MAG: hypothetical protein E6H93_13080 [Chloroflexota bacterium]
MSARVRKAFWLLLCLVAGGPCAFLVLETAGIPYAAVAFFAVVWVGRRRQILPETLLAFGLTYTIEICRYAITDLISSLQQGDYLTAAFFAVHMCVAFGIVGAGVFGLTLRRRMLEQDEQQRRSQDPDSQGKQPETTH